jgi:hypothetical protein
VLFIVLIWTEPLIFKTFLFEAFFPHIQIGVF